MGALFLLLLVPLIALQGAVVFETARRSLQLMRVSHWLGKIVAMFLSYFGWISLTIAGYLLTGGDAGLMDGLGFVLLLRYLILSEKVMLVRLKSEILYRKFLNSKNRATILPLRENRSSLRLAPPMSFDVTRHKG